MKLEKSLMNINIPLWVGNKNAIVLKEVLVRHGAYRGVRTNYLT